MLAIDDDYLAYIVDEFSIYLEIKLTDDEGNTRWDEVYYENITDEEANKGLMEHIIEHNRKPNVIKR